MNPLDNLGSLVDLEQFIIAWMIALARIGGFSTVFPIYSRLGLTGLLRGAVSLALSLPLVPFIMMAMPERGDLWHLPPMLFKEVVVGAIIGLFLGVPIWAAEVAGEILDLQRGVTFGDISDPTSVSNNNVTGNFFALLILAIYFSSGGLNITVKALYDSYGLWPFQSFMPIFSEQSGKLLLDLLDDIFGLGFMLVIPLILSFLLIDLSLALVARAAPQINIFILSLTVKNLTFALLIVLYMVFLVGYMRESLSWLIDVGPKLELVAPDRN